MECEPDTHLAFWAANVKLLLIRLAHKFRESTAKISHRGVPLRFGAPKIAGFIFREPHFNLADIMRLDKCGVVKKPILRRERLHPLLV